MAYTTLFARYKEQDASEIFASYFIDFQKGEDFDSIYEKLAGMVRDEQWNYQHTNSTSKYPILKNYLDFTFLRALDQNLIVFTEDKQKCIFNTGLQTPNEKDVFALFYKSPKEGGPAYRFFGFFDAYSDKVSGYSLPDIPTYIDNPADLIFDTNLPIEMNIEHIIRDNKDRLPEIMQENTRVAMNAMVGAKESLIQKVKRNYKIAIPCWYIEQKKITLMLPLNLTSDDKADLALVIDKEPDLKKYKARTIFSMDMAYNNARLIAKPDRDWLNP